MQQTQNQLKTDLLQIQQQFAQIDQSIKNAANDPLQQLRVYEEGIADERDSLFSIQQYLTCLIMKEHVNVLISLTSYEKISQIRLQKLVIL